MTVYNVSNATSLNAALKSAHGGDTIQLASGNYSGIVISNLNYSSAISITSADGAKEAVLEGLKVYNSSNISFKNLELNTNSASGAVDPYYAFRITSSNNISFSSLNVHGDLSANPSSQISGFYISNSKNVSILDSDFSHMNVGIVANNNNLLDISGNSFSYLDKGGVEMGGSSSVVVANNSFTDFEVSAGVHADAVQVYTAGTTQIASNISINNNVIERGTGDAIQGIFLQDEVGSLPFNNVNIQNNEVIGGMWNSIYVHAGVTGTLNVGNNLVESWAGSDPGSSSSPSATPPITNFLAGIDLLGNFAKASVIEAGNTAQSYLTGSSAISATPSGNTLVGSVAPVNPNGPGNNSPPLVVKPVALSLLEHGVATSNILSGDTGSGMYVADIGVGSGQMKAVGAGGTSFVGTYGTLTVHPDGSISYAETKDGLNVGQIYVDHFSTTIGSSSGSVTTSALDVSVTGSSTGSGSTNSIFAGAGTELISGFGSGSHLYSGSGADIFQFDGLSSSAESKPTTISGFKAGDTIDLSQVDANFHVVSRFDGQPNELMISHIATGTWEIVGELTGAKTPSFDIHLTNVNPSLLISSANIHI